MEKLLSGSEKTQEDITIHSTETISFAEVIEEAASRQDFYERTLVSDIEIPGFPTKPLIAEWKLGFGKGLLRGMKLSINRKENGHDNLVEMSVDDRWDGTTEEKDKKPHYFDVFHRFVHRDKMTDEEKKVTGIGSFALQMLENALRSISNVNSPKEIGMLANQPDVMRFAVKNGYGITNERQKRDFDALMKESELHRDDPAFLERGILPHFRFVNLQVDTPNGPQYVTERVVVNMDMLREYCDMQKPGFEKYKHLLEEDGETKKITVGVSNPEYSLLEMDIDDYTHRKEAMRSDRPHPFLMDFYFSKNLKI